MKSEITQGLRCVVALALCVALSSCGDDPELVKKREQLKAETSKLNGELSILKERLESMPKDKAVDIDKLKEQAENNRTQIASLESEVEALGKEKADIEKQHQAYKRKYVVK
jgi:FtsZ-binding cell division protein ZapB